MTTNIEPRYATMIRDMPQGERPRERLREYGPSYLNNSELIAILLRAGSEGENVLTLASRVLSTFNGLGGLGKATYGELCYLHGISDAKPCQHLAALELGRRLTSLQPEDRAVIRSPQGVFNLMTGEMSFFDQEHLRVLLLKSRCPLYGYRDCQTCKKRSYPSSRLNPL